jgi:AraC-like DNA-binding protein
VTHPEPAHSAEYSRLLKTPVVFGSNKNALLIANSWPDIKLHRPNPYVLGILSEHARKLMDSLQSAKTARGQAESILIPLLHKGDLSMDLIVKKMGLSRQTLYRKLKSEGTNYEKVLDSLRHKMALHYLGSGNASVNETAYLVGFSDPSAFSRAFKRWTGDRPGMVRSSKI